MPPVVVGEARGNDGRGKPRTPGEAGILVTHPVAGTPELQPQRRRQFGPRTLAQLLGMGDVGAPRGVVDTGPERTVVDAGDRSPPARLR